MRKTIATGLLLLTLTTIALTQGQGTPSSLIVKLDSTGALVVSSGSQIPPYTTSVFNSTVLKTDASGNLLVAGAGGGSGLTSTYNVNDYSISCNSTNASAALTTLLTTVSAAGGGTLYFPACAAGSTYRFNSQILIPNDAVAPQPSQVNIRFTGAGGGPQWYGTNAAVLDLRYTAVDGNAKIETRGLGTLQIDNLTIKDGGASNVTPIIHSSNTTLDIHENTFIASGNVAQNFIVTGGTSTVLSGNVDAPFQGYGTKIRGNHFRNGNSGLYGLNYSNAIVFSDNSFQANTGTVAIELDGSNGGGQVNHGNVINSNTIEMDIYTYGVKLTSAQYNTFVGNQFFDPDASTTALYNINATATQNTIICGYQPVARPLTSGTASSIQGNTYLCPNATNTNVTGTGTQSNEFPYGLIAKGTYDGTKVMSGVLSAQDQGNTNESISLGVDHANSRTVIEAVNNATGWPIYLNPVKLGRVVVPDLTVSGDTSTNISFIKGSSQAGNILEVQYGTTVNDIISINASGTLAGANNTEGTKWQIASSATVGNYRAASDVRLQFNSTTNLTGGAIDTDVGRNAAGVFGPLATHSFGMTSKGWINTAPSSPVACSSPTITNSNGTAAFRIDVGSSCTGVKTLVFTMPAASNGWNCHADNITTPSNIRVSATGTTSVTLTNYALTTGTATDFTAGDDIDIMCVGR